MGVKVREKPKGSGVWWLFINHQGHRKARRVGDGKAGRKAADLAAVQLRAKLAEGDVSVLKPSTPAPIVPTLREYSERWLSETIAPHRKPRTEQYYRAVLLRHIWPLLGSAALTDIKPAHVRALVADKIQTGAARNTVKNVAATLRAILYQAQQVDELIPTNPAARFGKFFDGRHDARQHVVVLEAGDVHRVLKAAAKWYPDHELMVWTLFYTGMWEGELLGLQWSDIDWPRSLIDLRRTVDVR